MQNRRAYPRIPQRQRVKIQVLHAPQTPHLEGRRFSCSVTDVSVSGIQFSIRRAIPVNVTLQLLIEYPQPRATFEMVGRVMWTRSETAKAVHHVGVFFSGTPVATMNAWRRTVGGMA